MHNNQSFYNSEEHNMRIAQFRSRPVEGAAVGTHVDNPPVDFKKVAEGFGVYAVGPIRRGEDLRPAIEKALAVVKNKKLPALVDVIAEAR
jgi:thiamine pyrophosphate-dependent acetolactate synthase large subunit-like protein